MKDKISCVIIEDEQPAAEILEQYIAKIDFLHLTGKFGSATQALKYLSSEHNDLLFLDINLPDISGISLLKSLSQPPHVIFTTAYPEYAVESFELEAVDYLLKPISFERFIKAVNRLLKIQQRNEGFIETPQVKEKPFVFIKSEKKMIKLFLDDILYLEAQKNYLLIYTVKENYRTYNSISAMEDKLPEKLFARIHRSFIVAVDKIEGYGKDFVEINKYTIPVGRMYHTAVSGILKIKQNIIKKK